MLQVVDGAAWMWQEPLVQRDQVSPPELLQLEGSLAVARTDCISSPHGEVMPCIMGHVQHDHALMSAWPHLRALAQASPPSAGDQELAGH